MDLEQVKQFLEDNKEQEDVQAYLNSFNQVSQEDYDAIVTERDDLLQHKPVELSEGEQAIQDKQQELWNKEVSLTLKDKGLERFANIVNVNNEEELHTAVQSLEDGLSQYKVDNAYVPKDHATADEYSTAKSSGDTKGMLKSLFGFN